MHHIAIMKKSWGLIPKILSGEKSIESRWYKNKSAPWDRITTGDVVYFKNAGEPVIASAHVSKVLQFENLSQEKIFGLLRHYGQKIGIEKIAIRKFGTRMKDKNYCILVFLKNAKSVKPFHVSKNGFGNACAWMCVKRIAKIKK